MENWHCKAHQNTDNSTYADKDKKTNGKQEVLITFYHNLNNAVLQK